jgi:hypothetical protein
VDPDPYPWTYNNTISKNPRTSSLGVQYRRSSLSLTWSVQEVHKSGRGKVQQVPCELPLDNKKRELFSIPVLKIANLFNPQ